MVELNNIEHTIIIPKKDNSLRPIKSKEVQNVATKMSNKFGGASVIPKVLGCWVNPKTNSLQCEENVEISSVGSASNEAERKENIKFMEDLGKEMGERFGQEEIMMFKDKVKLDFIHGKEKEKLGDDIVGEDVFSRNI